MTKWGKWGKREPRMWQSVAVAGTEKGLCDNWPTFEKVDPGPWHAPRLSLRARGLAGKVTVPAVACAESRAVPPFFPLRSADFSPPTFNTHTPREHSTSFALSVVRRTNTRPPESDHARLTAILDVGAFRFEEPAFVGAWIHIRRDRRSKGSVGDLWVPQ